jgi:hypothetical protein
MNEKQFIREALLTESRTGPIVLTERQSRILHSAMGMVTEASEFLDMLKKHIFYGKPFDLTNAIEEMGDSDWYRAIFIDATMTNPDEIRSSCIRKLRKRYGNNFSSDKEINRNLEEERKALENK